MIISAWLIDLCWSHVSAILWFFYAYAKSWAFGCKQFYGAFFFKFNIFELSSSYSNSLFWTFFLFFCILSKWSRKSKKKTTLKKNALPLLSLRILTSFKLTYFGLSFHIFATDCWADLRWALLIRFDFKPQFFNSQLPIYESERTDFFALCEERKENWFQQLIAIAIP